jgi:hypothetical protein
VSLTEIFTSQQTDNIYKNLPAGKLTLATLGDDNKVTARLSVSQHLIHRHLEAWKNLEKET